MNYSDDELDQFILEKRTQELIDEGIQPSLARLIAESELRNGLLLNYKEYLKELENDKSNKGRR